MKPKTSKIKSAAPLKIVRIVLWIMIVLIFCRGVISIVNSNATARQRIELEEYMQQMSKQEISKNTVIGFAENFIKDYFTDTGERDSDYSYRMSRYIADGVNIEAPGMKCDVTNVNACEVSFLGDTSAEVTVIATVNYGKAEKFFTIKVPIYVEDGRCAVDALPQIVPPADKADVNSYSKTYAGTEISDTAKKEIIPILESFFKTYYSGNENELSYYITEEFPYKHGLEGIVEFKKMDNLRVYFDAESGEYTAMAAISIADSEMVLKQNIYLTMLRSDGRYYISNISTR